MHYNKFSASKKAALEGKKRLLIPNETQSSSAGGILNEASLTTSASKLVAWKLSFMEKVEAAENYNQKYF